MHTLTVLKWRTRFMSIRRLLVLLVVLGSLASAQPRKTIAITHVTVIDTATGQTKSDVTVLITGERITSIRSGAVVPKGAQLVDGRGRFLIPGLFDMHVHPS